MAINLQNFALHAYHGYGQVAPAHLAHTCWSQRALRGHTQRVRQESAAARLSGRAFVARCLDVHAGAMAGALVARKAAQVAVTGPLDLLVGTGRFAPLAIPAYEAPGAALEAVFHRPYDSGAAGALVTLVIGFKVASFAAAGCALGALIGALRPRATLEGDALFWALAGANAGATLAVLTQMPLLLTLTSARLATASLKAAITVLSYGACVPFVLAGATFGADVAGPAALVAPLPVPGARRPARG